MQTTREPRELEARLATIANPARDTSALQLATRNWLIENDLDTDVNFWDLPVEARTTILIRIARAQQ